MPSAPVCIMKNEAGSEYLFKKCSRKPLLQGDLSHHGVKEKYQPLYQKLVLNMCLHQYIDTSYDCWLESFRVCMGCVYASPVNTPQSVAKSLYSSVIDSIFFLKESRSLKGDLCVRAF